MQWEFIVALVVAIPVILFPAAFIWYLNAGGIYSVLRKAVRERRTQEAIKAAAGTGKKGAGQESEPGH